MKKYNNYKKYYETHREQEKKRTNDYYWTNRDRILLNKREQRKQQPKAPKLTANDYKKLWLELLSYTKHNYAFWCLIMVNFENDMLEKKKESSYGRSNKN